MNCLPEFINRVICGHDLNVLRQLPDESVQCCVTSPPYWGLRDYGFEGQRGLEETPEEYIVGMVEVFREVRRVLKDDGTLWLNIGDTYNSVPATNGVSFRRDKAIVCPPGGSHRVRKGKDIDPKRGNAASGQPMHFNAGLKPKDLVGIPWMLAFALRADGWYLRQDIIWHKPNPMPESVRDRCTKAHEYLFLLSKSVRYFYNVDAIKEPCTASHFPGYNSHKGLTAYENGASEHRTKAGLVTYAQKQRVRKPAGWDTAAGSHGSIHRDGRTQEVEYTETNATTRNRRSVWTIATQPFPEAHFATFPPDLVRPCILAGSRPGDIILDPYGGSGTTAVVAKNLGRNYILIDGKREYCEMAERRIKIETAQQNMFANTAER